MMKPEETIVIEGSCLKVGADKIPLTADELETIRTLVAAPKFAEVADHSVIPRLRHKLASSGINIVSLSKIGFGLRREIKAAIAAVVAWLSIHAIPWLIKVT